jgi:phage tail protein X/plastocyanin
MKIKTTIFLFLFAVLAFNASATGTNNDDGKFGKYYALVIGVDNYTGEWTPLKTPVNDCEALKGILSTKYSFDEVVTLYDEDATRKNIMNYLDRITQNVTANDNLFIYFSGHGMEVGNEGYWVPSDANTNDRATLIANNEIKIALSKSVVKHALVMVDACFSGTIFKSGTASFMANQSESYYDEMYDIPSRQAMTAGGLEPVLDGSGEHSTFAKFVIKNLKKNQKPHMDVTELFQRIKAPVTANSPNTPRFGHIQNTNHEGGQFIFRIDDEKTTSCNFSGVKIKEGEKVVFAHEGGMLHALVNEYDKKVYYQWVKGTKTIEGEATPALKVDESGTYTVLVTTDDECADAQVIEVVVALPTLGVTIQEGNEVTFTNSGILHALISRDDEVEYEWSKNNFIVSQDKDLKVISSGLYTVTLRLKDGRKIATTNTKVVVKERTYTVRIGDNIERIARKFYGNEDKVNVLYEANRGVIAAGELLRVGTELSVPLLEEEEAAAVSDLGSTARVYLSANEDMPPFSQVGLLNNGMLTDIVKNTYKNTAQIPVVDFVSGNMARSNTFRGKSTASYPCVYNSQEANFFHYSDPIYQELTVIFTNKERLNPKDKLIKYTKDKDLKGLKVGLVRGFEGEKITQLRAQGIVGLLAFNSWEDCFAAMKAGKVDFVAAPQSVGLYIIKTSSDLQLKEFRMLDKELETTKFHLVISKNHPDGEALIKEFNSSLKELKEKGDISKIQNTHIDIIQNSN